VRGEDRVRADVSLTTTGAMAEPFGSPPIV